MPITLDESRTVALWYTPINKDMDLLGCLQVATSDFKDSPTIYDFHYCFRYYREDNVIHALDEKHWFHAPMKGNTREEVMARVRAILEKLLVLSSDNHVEPRIEEIVYHPTRWQEFLNTVYGNSWAYGKGLLSE